jgi:potassium-transporting ATPase potassium-binding subunit
VTNPSFQSTLALAMLFGRFVPILAVLALAGSLAAQKRVEPGAGTLPTNGPLFGVLVGGTVVLVAALTFFPALALGPIAEALA